MKDAARGSRPAAKRKPRLTRELRKTAYHEAGHAVAHHYQGLTFRVASIIPDSNEGTLGHVRSGKLPKWFDPEGARTDRRVRLRAEKEIISLFAGQIAQEMFMGHKPRYGMHRDNQQAVNLASYFGQSQDTIEAFLRFLFLTSRDLVTRRWREVQWVAEALVTGRKLNQKDLIEVIDREFGFPPLRPSPSRH